MKNLSKKLFALLLCAVFCCSLMPVYARTEEPSRSVRMPVSFPDAGKLGSGDSAMGSGGSLGLTVTVAGSETDFRMIACGYNKTVKLKVSATVDSGTLKYQWYEIKEENINFETGSYTYSSSDAISGATSASYTTPKITTDISEGKNRYFACVVTDKKGATASAMFSVSSYVNLYSSDPVNYPDGVSVIGFALSYTGGYVYTDDGGQTVQQTSSLAFSIAEKYQFYRKPSGGSWASLKTAKSPVSEAPPMESSYNVFDYWLDYTDKTAEMGKKYAYKVRAYINDTWTPFSMVETITFNPFDDVSLDDPSADYIAWAYNNDVVKGSYIEEFNVRLFNPSDPCTRMNFVMILWKMHGKPSVSGKNPFTDVSGSTSVSAVKWAVKKGLVTGTSSTTFSPDQNLSRINIIMILYKLAGSPKTSAESPYEDISGSKTTKAVNWAVSKKIISPVDETHFAPDANCSRALLVEILCKYNENYKIL